MSALPSVYGRRGCEWRTGAPLEGGEGRARRLPGPRKDPALLTTLVP